MAKNLSLQRKFSTSLSAQLAFIAGLSGLIYLLVFTLPFLLPHLYATIPPVDYTKLTGYSVTGFVAYVAGLGGLFWLYVWAIRLTMPNGAGAQGRRGAGAQGGGEARERLILIRLIFVASAILAGLLIFSYPLTAIDLFIYAIRTRGWALYGLNPLATAPETLPSADPWLGLAAEWVDAPSPYGPAWEWLSLGAYYLSGGDFLAHLFALKILAALAYLGCAWLVCQILQQTQPEWAIPGTIAFAWSPLALLESVQNGHNDIVMTFFLLAAVWALEEAKRRRNEETKERSKASYRPFITSLLLTSYFLLLGCLFLALSILVKFVTILLVPFFLLALTVQTTTWVKRLALMIGSGLLIAALVILPMLPLWPGWEKWAVLQAGSGAGRSLLALLILGFRNIWGTNFAFDFSRNLLLGIYALIYLYYLWQMVSSQRSVVSSQKHNPLLPCSPAPLLFASFPTLFWYVLLAAPVFHAWYLLWFLPLAALLLPEAAAQGVAAQFLHRKAQRLLHQLMEQKLFLQSLSRIPQSS
ncbi:MAG: hypothetical protein HYR94_18685 [Chloroflexi bacterium]|nr:hypothetical protein [Chloroflexota bacterium]